MQDATNQLVVSEQKAFVVETAAHIPPPNVPDISSLALETTTPCADSGERNNGTVGRVVTLKRGLAQRRSARSLNEGPGEPVESDDNILIDLT